MVDWQSIIKDYGDHVWTTIYRLVANQADAHDCYQETWLAALQFVEREAVREWRPFLTSLATRRAIDQIRKRTRGRVSFQSLETVDEPLGSNHTPFEQADINELADRLRAALSRIPAKHSEVFWLFSMEAFTHRQIAEQLGITTNESRVILHRARAQLSDVFEQLVLNERK